MTPQARLWTEKLPLEMRNPHARQREEIRTNHMNYHRQDTRSSTGGKPRLSFEQALLAVAGAALALPTKTGELAVAAPPICWALPCKVVA